MFGAVYGCSQPDLVREKTNKPLRVVSVDYCADQYVLKFVPRDRIVAVSLDAEKDFSYMRDSASGIPQVPSSAEDILALQPDLIVRSYGGGPNAKAYFEQAGVPVVQIGWASDLAGVKQVVRNMATALSSAKEGEALVAEMDARLATLPKARGNSKVLYMTPGGVTSGPGSLVDEMFKEAGLSNFETKPGWHALPLERLVSEQPDLIAYASFDSHVTPWSMARHPIARKQIRDVPTVKLEGAWTSCGGWFLVDAIEALAQGAAQ